MTTIGKNLPFFLLQSFVFDKPTSIKVSPTFTFYLYPFIFFVLMDSSNTVHGISTFMHRAVPKTSIKQPSTSSKLGIKITHHKRKTLSSSTGKEIYYYYFLSFKFEEYRVNSQFIFFKCNLASALVSQNPAIRSYFSLSKLPFESLTAVHKHEKMNE